MGFRGMLAQLSNLAVDIGKQRFSKHVRIPVGGLYTEVSPADIDSTYTPYCSNVWFKGAFVQSRLGVQQWGGTLSGDILGICRFQEINGTTNMLIFSADKLYYWNAGTSSWTDITGALVLAATQDQPYSWDILNDTIILTEYANPIVKINNALAASKLGGADGNYKAKFVKQMANHILLLNTDETVDGVCPFRVRWTNVGTHGENAVDWTGGTSGQESLIYGDDVGEITGCAMLGETLIIFKKHSIFQCVHTGESAQPFVFESVVENHGCVAPRTIVPIGEEILFLDVDGLYSYGREGTGSVTKLSENVDNFFFSSLNQKYIARAHAVYIPEQQLYVLFVPQGAATEPTRGWTYNLKTGAWVGDWWFKGITPTASGPPHHLGRFGRLTTYTYADLTMQYQDMWWQWGSGFTSEDAPLTVWGDTAGKVWKSSELFQDGSFFIDAVYQTKDFHLGSEYQTKGFRVSDDLEQRFRVDALQIMVSGVGTLQVLYSPDGGVSYLLAGTISLSTRPTREVVHIGVDADQMRFIFRLTSPSAGDYFKFSAYDVLGSAGGTW